VAATDRSWTPWPSGGEYDLINPHTGAVTDRLSAKEVFDRIVRAAWRTGDPGMVFIDRINASPATRRRRSAWWKRPIRVESNRFCLMRRATWVRSTSRSSRGRNDEGEWSLDWDEMERVVRLAVRFLDDVTR